MTNNKALDAQPEPPAQAEADGTSQPAPPSGELGPNGPSPEPVASIVDRLSRSAPQLGALVSGSRSKQMAHALEPETCAIASQVYADRGGDLPMTVHRLIRAFAETSTMRAAVFLRMNGEPITNKGMQRRMLAAYLSLVDREQRLAQVIGLERKARPIDPIEAVRQAVIEANSK